MRHILLAATLLAATPAIAGPTFILHDIGGVGAGTAARAGFEAAAGLWSAAFADNVTVRLDVGFQALGSGILGQTGSSSSDLSYASVRAALGRDAKSAADAFSFASLGSTLAFYDNTATTGLTTAATRTFDAGGSRDNAYLSVNSAEQKALGLRSSSSAAADASITFSSAFKWTFDPSAGVAKGTYDFVGIAAHEIGHALGFVSGVDTEDYYAHGGFSGLDAIAWATPLDLFRYKSGARDLTVGGTPCLSVDGGATCGAGFATGYYTGDHRQASHWKDNKGLGIMDPTAAAGERLRISTNDLTAFDVLGWNLAQPSAASTPTVTWSATPHAAPDGAWTIAPEPAPVGEPATLALLGLGALMLGRRGAWRP